jgi:hypothetical protein
MLVGCSSSPEEIAAKRDAEREHVAQMDDLDLCYELGFASTKRYWRVVMKEALTRMNNHHWAIDEQLCEKATRLGQQNQLAERQRERQRKERLRQKIQEASDSLGKAIANSF